MFLSEPETAQLVKLIWSSEAESIKVKQGCLNTKIRAKKDGILIKYKMIKWSKDIVGDFRDEKKK